VVHVLRREIVRRGSFPIAIGAWIAVAVLLALPRVGGSLSRSFEVVAPATGPDGSAPMAVASPKSERHPSRVERKSKKLRPAKKDRPEHHLGHVLPVPARLVSKSELKQPHHDYPAIDIGVPRWRTVRSVTSGKVERVVHRGACGNGVIVDGKDGYTYTYCHASATQVRRGRRVEPGTRLMRSGSTGNSTGPHLHLQIADPRGRLVCPQPLLSAWSKGRPRSPWTAGRHGCVAGRHHGKRHAEKKSHTKDKGRR
jgi:murein DD-endopeptidase MepM/ murein hydrolase activator NlpD